MYQQILQLPWELKSVTATLVNKLPVDRLIATMLFDWACLVMRPGWAGGVRKRLEPINETGTGGTGRNDSCHENWSHLRQRWSIRCLLNRLIGRMLPKEDVACCTLVRLSGGLLFSVNSWSPSNFRFIPFWCLHISEFSHVGFHQVSDLKKWGSSSVQFEQFWDQTNFRFELY